MAPLRFDSKKFGLKKVWSQKSSDQKNFGGLNVHLHVGHHIHLHVILKVEDISTNILKYQQNNSSISLFNILIEICGRRRKGCWGETTESRYQPTNGPDSPALYVSITTNTILPFF